jgi:hypothetical protein
LAARITSLTVYFKTELDAARSTLASGTSPERFVALLGEPEIEQLALTVLRPHLPLPAAPAAPKKTSFWAKLFGRG